MTGLELEQSQPQRYCRGYNLIKNTNTSIEVSNCIRLEGD